MIIVKSCEAFEAETTPMPDDPALLAAMADYYEELAKAGVLLDAAGLHPSRSGWRIRYDAQGQRLIDGPFAQARELIAGYTLIQVRSRDEALELSRRFPNPAGAGKDAVIELRELIDLDALAPSPQVARFRRLDAHRTST